MNSPFHFAVVSSPYHEVIARGLLEGALEYLNQKSAKVTLVEAPGAFEMPLIAKKLALTRNFDGIVCLGCVIKGDTAHFEYISDATAHGLMQAGLETGVPIAFGILTAYTEEQALLRARHGDGNKGLEAARACYMSAEVLRKYS